ncbi:hypothetical protein SLEP1_g27166 [Rubroshorea leprosula]|uniref:Uncharacterized protein n=1 Tax=Rubroshorea leprosula TaxID=152421 RepID=A0AAV5JV16_9ROSI|nr:hypothetical protein SLEP1_g27166 [Rubroshorea leprosula]
MAPKRSGVGKAPVAAAKKKPVEKVRSALNQFTKTLDKKMARGRKRKPIIVNVQDAINDESSSQQLQQDEAGSEIGTDQFAHPRRNCTNIHKIPIKPKRGGTKCFDVHKLGPNERIKVDINRNGQAVGPGGQKLSSFLGTIARNSMLCPLNYED